MLEDWVAGHLAIAAVEGGYPRLRAMRLLEMRRGSPTGEMQKEIAEEELDDIDARALTELLISPALGRPGRWRLQAIIARAPDLTDGGHRQENKPVRGFSVVRLADDGSDFSVPGPKGAPTGGTHLTAAEAGMVRGFGENISRGAKEDRARADEWMGRVWAFSIESHEREIATMEEYKEAESDLNLKLLQAQLENEALREARDEWPPEVTAAVIQAVVPKLGDAIDVGFKILAALALRIAKPPQIIDVRPRGDDERLARLEDAFAEVLRRLPAAPEASS